MKKEQDIFCKQFNMWNMSLSTFFNISPKVNAICGKCGQTFSKRFSMEQFDYQKFPTITCPYCHTKNKIPIKIDE